MRASIVSLVTAVSRSYERVKFVVGLVSVMATKSVRK
jgi:hypothetical protein